MIRLALTFSLVVFLAAEAIFAASTQTENIVLVTVDGVRWQEVFTGADLSLLDPEKHGDWIDRLGADSPEERRRALMPFFWKSLAPRGLVLGNRLAGSQVSVKNPHKFSYPGYAELLLGEVRPEVDSNDKVYSPRETVLEFVRRQLKLGKNEVAALASWEVFKYISVEKEGSVFVNAGREELRGMIATDAMRQVNELQFTCLTPWGSVRHDGFTALLALEHLKAYGPRLLYVALDETDDWAHDGRYDRVLDGIGILDGFLEELWNLLQSSSQYRDRTTLILTTDHGRGRTSEDWTDHGDVPGAEETWIAIIGPDTPATGETATSGVVYQDQVAATMLKLLGIDFHEFNPSAGLPIAAAFREE